MEIMDNVAQVSPNPSPIRSWFRRKLFPWKPVYAPDVPGDWRDCLTSHTYCELSIGDRIRVLLTGRIEVTTRTLTENKIGNTTTASGCSVLPWKFLE